MNININWVGIVNNAVSLLVAAVFVGAASIIWKKVSTIDNTIAEHTEDLKINQDNLIDTQSVLKASQEILTGNIVELQEEIVSLNEEILKLQQESKEPKEPKETKEPKESKQTKESNESKELKKPIFAAVEDVPPWIKRKGRGVNIQRKNIIEKDIQFLIPKYKTEYQGKFQKKSYLKK